MVLHSRDDGSLSLDTVRGSFDRFLRTDDVFHTRFTKNAFLLVASPPSIAPLTLDERVSPDLVEYLKSRSLTLRFLDDLDVPEGPYFIVDRQLHQAWRLYPDHLGAFSSTVIPNDTVPSGRGDEHPTSAQLHPIDHGCTI